MSSACFIMLRQAVLFSLITTAFSLNAIEPGDLIVNEIYFNNATEKRPNHYEGVELLVVKDKSNLNGLLISDRDFWNRDEEFRCVLQDLGQGFLNSVSSGTLIVIYDGKGEDKIKTNEFLIELYARTSLYCNTGTKTNAFFLGNYGDNLHVLFNNNQIDFVKYHAVDQPLRPSHPGSLFWAGGADGFVDIGNMNDNVGIRFLGDKPDLNDYPAAWQAYPETTGQTNNLGQPNGGRNTAWIEKLRKNNPTNSKPEDK